MADFEKMIPQRFLIDVINFGCDDYGMRIRIYSHYYNEGYREIGSVNLPNSHTMYKVVKTIKNSWFSNILSMINNWYSNTDKFVKGE